jgi:hypothetical protein
VSGKDLFSPARLRANWQRADEHESPRKEFRPVADDLRGADTPEKVAERVSLVELVAELQALVERQEQGVDRFMEHAVDCLVEGVATGDQPAIAEALNAIEDLIDESGQRIR